MGIHTFACDHHSVCGFCLIEMWRRYILCDSGCTVSDDAQPYLCFSPQTYNGLLVLILLQLARGLHRFPNMAMLVVRIHIICDVQLVIIRTC